VQDLISALGAVNGSPGKFTVNGSTAVAPMRTGVAARAPEILSSGIADGLPTAQTIQDVLRHRGRADATKTHLIFFEDEGESRGLTFGELFPEPSVWRRRWRSAGSGVGIS